MSISYYPGLLSSIKVSLSQCLMRIGLAAELYYDSFQFFLTCFLCLYPHGCGVDWLGLGAGNFQSFGTLLLSDLFFLDIGYMPFNHTEIEGLLKLL